MGPPSGVSQFRVVDAGLAAVCVNETRGGGMVFREVRMFEIREMLRLWLGGEGLRSITRLAMVGRKTAAAMWRRR
ncbi:MAG: hypothetical protein ACLFRT_15015 [Actinomycetota bacterium]